MSNTNTEAIEPWVADHLRQLQLQQHALALHQAHVRQADLHSVSVALASRTQSAQQASTHHSILSRQHIDVDV